MAEHKTRATAASVKGFIDAVGDEDMRRDCRELMKLMKEVTGKRPRMWGPSMVGYGSYHYRYASGREGDCFVAGFSPRKKNLTVYVMAGLDRYPELLARLGRFKRSKSCLYVKRLGDVDRAVLRKLIAESVKDIRKMYP